MRTIGMSIGIINIGDAVHRVLLCKQLSVIPFLSFTALQKIFAI
jgi:hypothetical protein